MCWMWGVMTMQVPPYNLLQGAPRATAPAHLTQVGAAAFWHRFVASPVARCRIPQLRLFEIVCIIAGGLSWRENGQTAAKSSSSSRVRKVGAAAPPLLSRGGGGGAPWL